MKKICTKCGVEKDVSEFNKHKRMKDGLEGHCRSCRKKYRHNNKEHIRERDARYNALYRHISTAGLVHDREYSPKEERTIKERERRKKEYDKEYRRITKANRNARDKLRRKVDVTFRITTSLRNRLNKTIKRGYKSASTLKLLGCSVEQVRKHLENQFTEGMNWDNYGLHGWHIDHIKPCASFDLTKPDQQKECFHYTNLQPLWAKDNLEKSDKISVEFNNI